MDNLLVVAFEAHHLEANRHRRYELAVGRDLLDAWTVTIRYGRTGQGGQEKRYAAATADTMRALMRTHLLRRLSAPRRIGCAYRLVRCDAAPGFDPEDWLSREVMARFVDPPAPRDGDRASSASSLVNTRADRIETVHARGGRGGLTAAGLPYACRVIAI